MVSPTTATYAMRRRVSLSKAEWQHRRLHESRHGSLGSQSPQSSLPATPTDSAYACIPSEANSTTILPEQQHPNSTAEPEVQHLSFYDARTGIVGRATTETITTTTATTSTTAKWSRRGDGRTTVTITTSPYSDQSLSRNSSVSTQTSSSAPSTPQRHSMHSSICSTSSSSTSYTAPPSRSGSLHCRPAISRSNSVASAGPNEHHYYRGWPFPTKSELYRSNSAHQQEHFQLEHGPSFDLKQGSQYRRPLDDGNDYNINLYTPHSPHRLSHPVPPANPATTPPSRRHLGIQQSSPARVNQPTKSKPVQQPPALTATAAPPSPATTASSSSSSSSDMIRRNSLKRLPASFCPESSGGPSSSKSGIRRNRAGSTSLTRILKPKDVVGGMAEYY
ncbi:hypothetical protein KC360_g3985 [Hortaea werneckii]|nr:hypothetical protein KC325_g4068 [Hortaea werneckii]KAI6994372.1 hypothetical protein KC359_g4635 [Hortaea werneckii]KAI7146196.1 hypothetical protein KC344_g3914 [Hortaea werneckii]KAI7174921.1 hypothetical protein KC360_g3985 [Hortaea werneckii]KAI7510434.1 hypothetical protein KC347_g4295 [Hortaea werneckii]